MFSISIGALFSKFCSSSSSIDKTTFSPFVISHNHITRACTNVNASSRYRLSNFCTPSKRGFDYKYLNRFIVNNISLTNFTSNSLKKYIVNRNEIKQNEMETFRVIQVEGIFWLLFLVAGACVVLSVHSSVVINFDWKKNDSIFIGFQISTMDMCEEHTKDQKTAEQKSKKSNSCVEIAVIFILKQRNLRRGQSKAKARLKGRRSKKRRRWYIFISWTT